MSPRQSQTETEQTNQQPELDRILLALSSEPRRKLLSELMDRPRNESVTLPDAVVGDNMEPMEIKQFKTNLHHNHLPMLAECGIITWVEKEDQYIAKCGDNFDQAAAILAEL